MLNLKTLAKTMIMLKISVEPDENVSLMKSCLPVQLEYERSTQRLYKSFVQKDSCNFTANLHSPGEILLNLNPPPPPLKRHDFENCHQQELKLCAHTEKHLFFVQKINSVAD